ncbi:MAG: glycosyltransferase [Sandaracinaceae bacterium]
MRSAVPRVSIVVPVFDGVAFLDELFAAVRGQTIADWELLLFDDGSRDRSLARCRDLAAKDPRVRAFSHPGRANRGQLATRVAAAQHARADVIAMLDQDDVWEPTYLEKHLARWAEVAPRGVVLSYGPALYWHPDDPAADYVQPMPPGTPGVFEPPTLLSSFFANEYAATPLPSCSLIQRHALLAAARFGSAAQGSQCEDQYLAWFIAARWRIAIHDQPWVRYRRHDGSALLKALAMPEVARRAEVAFLEDAKREVKRIYPDHPLVRLREIDARIARLRGAGATTEGEPAPTRARVLEALGKAASFVRSTARRTLRASGARARLGIGVTPLSDEFGEDRGTPLTRYYVEQFLRRHAGDVRGACLEFEGDDYVLRYGAERVESVDVLHLDASNPRATIVADLTQANDLPSDRFDAIVCTFVLHEIFDARRAVRELARILRPGGTVLFAVPHVTMCEPRYGERWRFTVQGLTELLEEAFGSGAAEVVAYGNSLTAAAQLRGLVAEELSPDELDVHDPRFAVVICARVQKPRPIAEAAPTARALAAAKASGRALVLLYHRTAELERDPHLLSVPPESFRRHLDVITQLGQPLSLTELAQGIERGAVPHRGIAITFDDGYADNLLSAAGELRRFGVPATMFITSGQIGAQREFWWDAIDRLLLESVELPDPLVIEAGDRRLTYSLGEHARWSEAQLEKHRAWNVLDAESPTPRHVAFREALDALRPLDDMARSAAIAQLTTAIGIERAARPSHRPMDVGELLLLGRDPLITIGAHTVTHAQLSALPMADQRAEIADSRAWLETTLDRRVGTFAYPFGSARDYDRTSVSLVRECGFSAACANEPGVVTTATDVLEIPRVMVLDWKEHELAERIETHFRAG